MILCSILIGLLLLVLAALLLPIHLYVQFIETRVVYFRYAFFKYRVCPPVQDVGKPRDRQAEKPNKQRSRRSDLLGALFAQETPADAMIELCALVKELLAHAAFPLRRMKIRKYRLEITVAEADAAETALAFGNVCAAVYSLRAMVEGAFRVKSGSVDIKPCFEQGKTTLLLDLHCTLLPIHVAAALCAMGVRYLRFHIKYHRKNKKDGASI